MRIKLIEELPMAPAKSAASPANRRGFTPALTLAGDYHGRRSPSLGRTCRQSLDTRRIRRTLQLPIALDKKDAGLFLRQAGWA